MNRLLPPEIQEYQDQSAAALKQWRLTWRVSKVLVVVGVLTGLFAYGPVFYTAVAILLAWILVRMTIQMLLQDGMNDTLRNLPESSDPTPH